MDKKYWEFKNGSKIEFVDSLDPEDYQGSEFDIFFMPVEDQGEEIEE